MQPTNTRRTKIVMVLYYYHPYVSGVSVYAKRIAEGLVRLGYDVTVLTSRYEKGLPTNESINGVTVVRRPVLLRLNKGVIMPTYWFDIVRYAYASDFVNAHLPLAESGIAALFVPKRKMVTTYHCDIYLGKKLLDQLITFATFSLMHLQLMHSRAIITNTRDYFEHSKMRRYIAKVTPIYPPVAASEFTPIDSGTVFDRIGVGANDVKIGFVGRVVYEKGIDYLLQAIPYLKKKLPHFKIIMVGDYEKVAGGSTKDQLDKYIQLYPENILFTGYLNDADRNRFYSGLDVFVLPSIDPLESFGIVQVEALLCGVPVVASDLPGVREIVAKTGYGRIAKVKNSKDIAKQIIEVVTHPMRYKPSRKKVVNLFDSQHSIEAYSAFMSR